MHAGPLIGPSHVSTEGRKEKELLVFRVKGIKDHELVRWQLKKNETFVGKIVEQR
jgi:hypothetical protein